MKQLLGSRILDLWDTWTNTRDMDDDVLNTMEMVVDSIDSKIRLVPGYQKKLYDAVQASLEYSNELVNQRPPAIEVSRKTFSSDPYVNAFFANIEDLQTVFSHSSEIQDYMEEIHEDDSSCCALLCMRRTEKTVLGMELNGEMLKKDVRQIAVSFSEHTIYSPAASESETRRGLKHCMFNGLVSNTLGQLMELKLTSHNLQTRHRMLHSRLRSYQQRNGDSSTDPERIREIEATEQELKAIEQEMMDTPVHVTPQILLDQAREVLEQPENYIRLSKIPLRLNKMGIKIKEQSSQPCNELQLCEVAIGDDAPRVVALATFPREELLPRKRMVLPD